MRLFSAGFPIHGFSITRCDTNRISQLILNSAICVVCVCCPFYTVTLLWSVSNKCAKHGSSFLVTVHENWKLFFLVLCTFLPHASKTSYGRFLLNMIHNGFCRRFLCLLCKSLLHRGGSEHSTVRYYMQT